MKTAELHKAMIENDSIMATAVFGNIAVTVRQSTTPNYYFVGHTSEGVYTGYGRPIHKDYIKSVLAIDNLCPSQWNISLCDPVNEDPYLSDNKKTKTDQLVYFIAGAGLIKIGISADPDSRLESLRLLSPVPLRIIATIPGGAKLERELHKRFANKRIRGEWFDISENDISDLL